MAAAHQPTPPGTGFPRTIFHVDMDAFLVSVEELCERGGRDRALVFSKGWVALQRILVPTEQPAVDVGPEFGENVTHAIV